jgi:hypothetical protein
MPRHRTVVIVPADFVRTRVEQDWYLAVGENTTVLTH